MTGFEDAIAAAFPHTSVQSCVVHLIRDSLRPVPRKHRAAVAAELRKAYTVPDAAPTQAASSKDNQTRYKITLTPRVTGSPEQRFPFELELPLRKPQK
ncbi:transposase [Actinomadura sp. NPDC047616]|uniref:transposase n=1 Tax=Actinomadura sp. NPDC047616 TaxID=3155914 RepID=UPI0033C4712A